MPLWRSSGRGAARRTPSSELKSVFRRRRLIHQPTYRSYAPLQISPPQSGEGIPPRAPHSKFQYIEQRPGVGGIPLAAHISSAFGKSSWKGDQQGALIIPYAQEFPMNMPLTSRRKALAGAVGMA